MTYQAARNSALNYGRITRQAMPDADRARRVINNRSPQTNAGVSASQRAEMQRRRDEAYRRALREEAAAARRLEEQRRRHERELAQIRAYEAKMKRERAAARKAEKAKAKQAARLEEEAFRRSEIRVEKKKMPWQFILGVAIAFVLLMSMVFSFAQLSEANATLADLDAQIRTTEAKADKLRLQLEEKNDLDLIEEIALSEYNMIKEGSVQKKYITISEGDRVVLENQESESEIGFMAGMLSSVATVFDDLIDYIK